MSELRTDFKDDVLDVTQNEKRKYRVIHNEDGTISLEDATAYLQQGDSFGANDLNEMNRMANQMNKAAGEILTMADDIDTLQDDVATLESDLTTLESGLASERLLWNISDEVYSKEIKLDIPTTYTNFVDVANMGYVKDMAIFDDNKLSFMFWNGNACRRLEYDGTSWVSHTISDFGTSVCIDNMYYHEGYYYIVYHASGSGMYIKKYDTATNKTASGFSDISISYYNYGLSVNKIDDELIIANSSDTVIYLTIINLKNWSKTTYSVNAWGNKIYLLDVSKLDGNTYCFKCRLQSGVTGLSFTYNKSTGIKNAPVMAIPYAYTSVPVKVIFNNGSKYYSKPQTDRSIIINRGINCEALPLSHEIVSICEHNGEIYALATDKYFYKIEVYKKATSYATQGTKILSNNSFAISDNLEAIDNGFLVTADGEVTIGIYE